jgi:transposase
VISDAQGTPLTLKVTAANVHDSVPAIDMLDNIPLIKGQRGRPRKRPDRFQGDRAYGSRSNKLSCIQRKVKPELASLRTPHGSGLGKTRWVIERTQAWYSFFRRLKVCYEKTQISTLSFHAVATILIVWNVIIRI